MSEPNRKRQRTSASFKPKLDDVKLENEAMEQLIDENEQEFQGIFSKLQESANKRDAKLKQKNQEMKEKIEDLERQIDDFGFTETNLRLTVKQLDKQRRSMEDKLGEMQTTCDENGKKIRDLEEQLTCKTKAEKELLTKVAELKETSGKIEADHINSLKEIKKLKDEHEKEMTDMKAKMQTKFDNEKKVFEAEIIALNSTNADFSKKLSEAHSFAVLNQQAFNNNLITAKANESRYQTTIKALEEKDKNSCQSINGQRERIQELENQLKEAKAKLGVRYLTLEQIRDGSTISNGKIMNNVTVVKVTRIIQGRGYWNLYSTDMPNEKPVIMKTSDFAKNTVLHFQVNGELDLNESDFNMILPRLHSCTLTKLDLHGAVISLDIFKKLTGARTITSFKNVIVKCGLGAMLKISLVLKELPYVSVFEMDEIETLITDEICDSLDRLPALPNLRRFTLKPIDPSFNLIAFGLFIKKNPATEFYLQYCGLSQNEKITVAKKEEQFYKTLPKNCKVCLEY